MVLPFDMRTKGYERIECLPGKPLAHPDPAVGRVLMCSWRVLPASPSAAVPIRSIPRILSACGRLLCAVGVGHDESTGFLRALDTLLVTLTGDGNFRVPGSRACSPTCTSSVERATG